MYVVMVYQETVVVGGGGDADTGKILKLVTLKLVKLLRKDLSSLTTAELDDIQRFEHVRDAHLRQLLCSQVACECMCLCMLILFSTFLSSCSLLLLLRVFCNCFFLTVLSCFDFERLTLHLHSHSDVMALSPSFWRTVAQASRSMSSWHPSSGSTE